MNIEIEYEITNIIDEIIQKIESETTYSENKKKETRGRKSSNKVKEIHNCTECEFSTDKRLSLKKHFILNHSDKIVEPFKCEFCDKVFKDPGQLSNHRNVHIGLKPYKCNECELNFTTKGELIRHTRYKHTLERPHKCSFCDYSSVELSKLKRHIRVHTGERPYLCPYCDYASRDTFKLKRHLRIHTGEKPYECPVCQHSFTQSNSLKVHMKKNHPDIPTTTTKKPQDSSKMTNSTISPVSPFHIDSSASSSSAMSAHHEEICLDELSSEPVEENQKDSVALVTTEIFECKECAMKFLSNQLLSEHTGQHTGARPFSCDICGVKFTHKFALRSHKLSHDADYSINLKQKLKKINRSTAIANSTMPVEVKLSQQNFIYKKSIRNMMGIKEKDNSVKETLKTLIQQQKLKNKIIEKESEKIKKANKTDESEKLKDAIKTDNISVEIATSEIEPEKTINDNKQPDINDENDDSSYSEPPSPKIQFKVGQNKRKIQHAENSFVIMNDNKKAKLINENNTEDTTIIENNTESNSQKTINSDSRAGSVQCKLCTKKYATEANLNKHVRQIHSAKKLETTSPSKPIGRDEFLSHLNATLSATTAVPKIETVDTTTIEIAENIDETKSIKKPKVKSIYDQKLDKTNDDNQPKISDFVNFTPAVKPKKSPSNKSTKMHLQQRSHLAEAVTEEQDQIKSVNEEKILSTTKSKRALVKK